MAHPGLRWSVGLPGADPAPSRAGRDHHDEHQNRHGAPGVPGGRNFRFFTASISLHRAFSANVPRRRCTAAHPGRRVRRHRVRDVAVPHRAAPAPAGRPSGPATRHNRRVVGRVQDHGHGQPEERRHGGGDASDKLLDSGGRARYYPTIGTEPSPYLGSAFFGGRAFADRRSVAVRRSRSSLAMMAAAGSSVAAAHPVPAQR